MEPVKNMKAHRAKVATPRRERGGGNGANLATVIVGDGDGPLNADFVEWMMNWPIGWTSLAPLPAGNLQTWRERTAAGTWWQTAPGVPGMAKKSPRRADRIRVVGNGQCPAALVLAWSFLYPYNPKPPHENSDTTN